MTKRSQDNPPETSPDPSAAPLEEQSLDKIRDILFGERSRVQEERLGRIEEVMLREVQALKGDLMRRLDLVEARVKKEHGELERKWIESEREGILGREQLARDIDGSRRHLEERVAEIAERSEKNVEFVQEHVAGENRALREALTRRQDELGQALERALAELKAEKADRALVAGVLNELALRLGDAAKKFRSE